MVYGGAGLGRWGGKVVFVPFTAPGDRVKVEVHQEKKDFIDAKLLEILSSSAFRTSPFCPLFGQCGGCHYQHIFYKQQIRIKEGILREFLDRKLKAKNFEFFPMIPSPPGTKLSHPGPIQSGHLEGRESHRILRRPKPPSHSD